MHVAYVPLKDTHRDENLSRELDEVVAVAIAVKLYQVRGELYITQSAQVVDTVTGRQRRHSP